MNNGYIKLWRKTRNKGMLKNHKLWAFWSWCLLEAAYQEKVVTVGRQEVKLNPGQLVLTRRKVSQELGINEQSIRTFLANLKTNQQITIKSTNKYSVITIVKWHTYQQDTEATNPQTNPQIPNKRITPLVKEYKEYSEVANSVHAKQVLDELNRLSGKKFRHSESSLKPITARLKSFTVEDCMAVLKTKWADKDFDKKYFQPSTLFRPGNFENYLNQSIMVVGPTSPPPTYEPKTDLNDEDLYGAATV